MPTHKVNLEALIQRQDFEASSNLADLTPTSFKAEELGANRNYYRLLRKPDFQRETHNWTPQMIVDFVRSFLDNDLIPALILWNSLETGKVFVIDGCHRISALIAWVNDDYGNGDISKAFFKQGILKPQKDMHQKTKELMDSQIGSFKRLNSVLADTANARPEELRRASTLSKRFAVIQDVTGGAESAEKSFLNINGNPASIDDVEMDLIKARKKPNVIATRAIIRASTGHLYGPKFARSDEIEKLATEVYGLMFGHVLDIDKKVDDIPRAGQPYSRQALLLVLDVVNRFNRITDGMWKSSENTSTGVLQDDLDGSKTIEFLQKIHQVTRIAFGGPQYQCSLGFEPGIYCYGSTWKFQPSAYIGTLQFSLELDQKNWMRPFTDVRKDFEEFLLTHNYFIKQLLGSRGSRFRSVEPITTLYRTLFDLMRAGERDAERILSELKKAGLDKLSIEHDAVADPPLTAKRKRFTKSVTNAAVIRQAVMSRATCTECKARLAPAYRSEDHKTRVADSGTGSFDNHAFTHPYCNSGYKERAAHEARQPSQRE